MTVTYSYRDPERLLLTEDRRAVVGCLNRSLDLCREVLPGPREVSFDIVVTNGENSKTFPVEGAGAGNEITIYLDAKQPIYRSPGQHHFITSAVAHEWHHLVRDCGFMNGKTLGHILVSEGLALAFEVQLLGRVPYAARAVPRKRLLLLEDQMKVLSRQRDTYSNIKVLTGGRGTHLHRWFGYSFAYALVNGWLEREAKTPVEAVDVKANKILRPWRNSSLSVVGSSSFIKNTCS
ncbi:MAG: DUF2268 domain-containing putative Zn-dependent protease [Alphaproteobacteria bacterium]|nr:DUF2268 domain-containing putative Zn-dependent protease [Alphaproteobacteria bacterium]